MTKMELIKAVAEGHGDYSLSQVRLAKQFLAGNHSEEEAEAFCRRRKIFSFEDKTEINRLNEKFSQVEAEKMLARGVHHRTVHTPYLSKLDGEDILGMMGDANGGFNHVIDVEKLDEIASKE